MLNHAGILCLSLRRGGGSLDTKSDFRKISNNNIKLKVLLNCEE